MSGIVGLFNLDGRNADPRQAARMLGAIAHRGPDASRVWSSGAVALGHGLLAATPESVGEIQPLQSAGLTIVFDGRLDNRDELAAAIADPRVPPLSGSDAAFVAAAYRRWGVECGARLLGDFAFAVWDSDRRRMFCARDVMAQKPFYYHHAANLFLFASEPQAILCHPAVSRRPNEGMVGEYLSVITSTTETLFADVQRLAPAHCITVSPGQLRIDAYWSVDTARTIRYASGGEYGDHLRALLRQIVGDRLRCSTDTGVMLSGGVDSSSMLATAVQLRRSGELARDCSAFSMIDPGGPLDEQAFMDRTVSMAGCASHQFRPAAIPVEAYRDATRRRADLASSPSARLMTSVKEGARQLGVRVLLCGIGSDEWLGGSFYHAADLFRSLHWFRLATYLGSAWSSGMCGGAGDVLKVMTWPLLPRAARKRIKTLIGRDAVPRFVQRDFAKRIGLAERLDPGDPDPPFATIAQRSIYRNATSAACVHGFEDEERSAAEFGLEVRYPFADRRLMEFGLAIPEEVRRRGGMRKAVLRDAMTDWVPVEVRQRLVSPNAGSVFMPALRALADEGLFHDSAVAREGWIDSTELRAFFAGIVRGQASGNLDYTQDVWPLWLVAAVELWMHEGRGAACGNEQEHTCEMTAATTSAP